MSILIQMTDNCIHVLHFFITVKIEIMRLKNKFIINVSTYKL